MNLHETIVLVPTAYVIIGLVAAIGAALSGAGWKCAVFGFFCWPRIAYYGLMMMVKRVRN